MIRIEEIPKGEMEQFWILHWEYLNRDVFDANDSSEDRAYFQSAAYRNAIEGLMEREPDKIRPAYFFEENARVGCAQYITYKSEDGKCFILDFWVFPEHRGNGAGHRCFEALSRSAKEEGARYFAINCTGERARSFWQSLGFVDDGVDEYGDPLMKRVDPRA